MSEKFRTVERDQLLLIPHSLQEWIPKDDIVHFVIEAAEMVPLDDFQINERGTGKDQYHPQMMLGLLLYCYSHGIFSSRRIERATYKDVSVRYLCANQHPDHNTICIFRRRNEKAVSSAFLHILSLAREMGIVKIGTVSTDGTKIKANASLHKSVRYDRAGALEKELEEEIAVLLEKAENADNENNDDDDQLKGDLKRLKTLKEKMIKAQKKLEEQKRVKDTDQINMTDSDSRIMRKNSRSGYTQSYNAQAVVDADGSYLVVGARVTNHGVDNHELSANMESIPRQAGKAKKVLADNGYVSEEQVYTVESNRIKVYLPVSSEEQFNRRKHDWRPVKESKKKPVNSLPWIKKMSERMREKESRDLYRLRKQTVEPVFGIIKQALGFRQFHLRGLEKVNLEWTLVMTAYNVKRLAKIMI